MYRVPQCHFGASSGHHLTATLDCGAPDINGKCSPFPYRWFITSGNQLASLQHGKGTWASRNSFRGHTAWMPHSVVCTAEDTPRESLKTGKTTKRFCEAQRKILARGEGYIHATTINSFPDNVLLEIFDICRRDQDLHFHPIWDWHRLTHICPRWRRIIFSSPRRLDLKLLCTHGTPVEQNLGYWPPLPLIIDYCTYRGAADNTKSLTPSDEENVVAALEDSTRVQYVGVPVTSSLLGKMAMAVQKPFPALTHLWLSSKDENLPALPDEFLSGSAPGLRVAHLEGIPFPALPTLLSSALGLVDLRLLNIPLGGYISPEVMVANLEGLTGLRTLLIGFKSPTPPSRTKCRNPITRTSLPSLTTFGFHGVKEYLEDLVVQIDTPQLDYFRISYFNQLDFQVHQLSEFVGRAQNLFLVRFKRARVDFGVTNVYVSLYCEQEELLESHFSLQISCRGLDWQVSHVAQTLSQIAALLSDVGDLSIDACDPPPGGKDYTDHTEWLELFRLFTAVETLHVSGKLAGHVAHGLEGVTEEMVTEMLPALRSLFLEDEPLTSVKRFITARRLFGRPVTIVDAPGEFFERLESPSESEFTSTSLPFKYPDIPSSSVAQKVSIPPDLNTRESILAVTASTTALIMTKQNSLSLQFSCQRLGWQVTHMAQLLSQCFAIATLSFLDDLSTDARDLQPGWEENVDSATGRLRSFAAVETLHISKRLAGHATEETVSEMLTPLRSNCFEDEPTGVDYLLDSCFFRSISVLLRAYRLM